MMKAWSIPGICILLAGCAGLVPAPPESVDGIRARCLSPFPRSRCRMVHSIEGTMPGGRRVIMTGVSDITPETGRIHAVMLTLEGLVFFEALREKGVLTVKRSLPPFDSEAFARGVMDDMALVFLPPGGKMTEAGYLSKERQACRFIEGETAFEIRWNTSSNVRWELFQYRGGALTRSVEMGPPGAEGVPRSVVLKARGPVRYRLGMRLTGFEKAGRFIIK